MLLPGQIASATTRFDRPGTYRIICHEFCGPGHQNMVATIIVEDTEANSAEEAAAE
jgi:cytochrome c oxidase subunit 2